MRLKAMIVTMVAAGLTSVSAWSADWDIFVACPDEFPGPPDCFDCQLFGNTQALDYHAQVLWEDFSTYGYPWFTAGGWFDPTNYGESLWQVHYHCNNGETHSPMIVVTVASYIIGPGFPETRSDRTWVSCDGTWT